MAITRVKNVKPGCRKFICKEVVSRKAICRKPISRKPKCKVVKKRNSAFRAVSGINQNLLDDTTAQVLYQVQELDLNNEYNPANSTFRPKQKGVYALFASVFFQTVTVTTFTLDLEIRVNGVPRILDQEDFTNTSGMIDAAGIVQLQARDRVQVFASVVDKNIVIQSGLATRFEGARVT